MPRISLGKRMSNAEATKARSGQIAERQRTDALALLAAATARIEVMQPFIVHLPPTGLPSGRQVLELDG